MSDEAKPLSAEELCDQRERLTGWAYMTSGQRSDARYLATIAERDREIERLLKEDGMRAESDGYGAEVLRAENAERERDEANAERDMDARRERNVTAAATLGGFVEGQPTQPENWLQRARALVAFEEEHKDCQGFGDMIASNLEARAEKATLRSRVEELEDAMRRQCRGSCGLPQYGTRADSTSGHIRGCLSNAMNVAALHPEPQGGE